MDSNLCIKKLMTVNNNYQMKYLYSRSNGTIKSGKLITILLSANKYYDKYVDLVSNPIIIFELENENLDLEFFPERIFATVAFEIGGCQIDKIYTNQIVVLQKKYNLKVKRIGSKVFFPLPINCLLKSNGIPVSKCMYHELRFFFEFNNEQFINCIQDMCVRTELLILEKKPEWKNICEPILFELLETSIYSNNMKNYIQNNSYENFESKQIIKFKQNQFTGLENMNGQYHCKINLHFNHDVERFYIWFENRIDNIVYEEKSFDKIAFIADNICVLEMNYEDLVYNTLTLNNNIGLGKGIYEINWKHIINYNPNILQVELNGLTLPNQDICFSICAESYNYLEFEKLVSKIIFRN